MSSPLDGLKCKNCGMGLADHPAPIKSKGGILLEMCEVFCIDLERQESQNYSFSISYDPTPTPSIEELLAATSSFVKTGETKVRTGSIMKTAPGWDIPFDPQDFAPRRFQELK